MRTVLAFLFAVLAGTAAPVFAGLDWKQTELQLEAAPLDEKIEAAFHFTNTGTTTVTIVEARPSCGCTVPTLAQREFAPGESGDLHIVFTIGEGMEGPQEKTLAVLTHEPAEQMYVLTLRVNIPGLWDVQPKFVKWESGATPTAQSITIHARHPELARPVSVEARDSRFTAELTAVADEAGKFIVTVTPTQTATPMFTSILVATTAPGETPRSIQLYAIVR